MNPYQEPELNRGLLASLLQSPLLLTRAHRRIHPSGFSTPDEVISTHRYIFILKGRLKYQVEGTVANLREKTLIYVPAFVRRRWWVPRGETCENLWCEFSMPSIQAIPATLFYAFPPDAGLEKNSLFRILKIWKENNDPIAGGQPDRETLDFARVDSWSNLRMAGELKATLARFWPRAQTWSSLQAQALPIHPVVKAALHWLEQNHGDPRAASNLLREIDLSPNHFRLIFRQQTGKSPARCLKEMRLRRARGLLHQSNRPVKEIAQRVGFSDPLHFTKQYHRFWGHPPTRDRAADSSG